LKTLTQGEILVFHQFRKSRILLRGQRERQGSKPAEPLSSTDEGLRGQGPTDPRSQRAACEQTSSNRNLHSPEVRCGQPRADGRERAHAIRGCASGRVRGGARGPAIRAVERAAAGSPRARTVRGHTSMRVRRGARGRVQARRGALRLRAQGQPPPACREGVSLPS
jgi:hypothetical protein